MIVFHFRCRAGSRLAIALAGLAGAAVCANPVGPTVVQGKASFSSSGPQMTIQTSDRAYINWQSFNIGAGQTTTFVQPSVNSLVWNHINDPNPSQILGSLNANGYVVLQNSAGFFIGGQASITAHGLIMTTAPIAVPELTSGGAWDFGAPPPTSSVINYGQINLSQGGALYLIADNVENHGTISAPGGDVGLYAGKEVLVSQRPDGLGLSAKVTLPAGSVDNEGHILADAGTIAMNAKVVNQGGLVQANSVAEVNGVIQLVAGDSVNLRSSSTISATGDSHGTSSGGTVTILGGAAFTDQAGSRINVSGGADGGNAGKVEISADRVRSLRTAVSGHAAAGFQHGTFTLDPVNVTLDPTMESTLLNSFLSGGMSQLNVTADNTITVSAVWNLPSLNYATSLNLTAGNNIVFNNNGGIEADLVDVHGNPTTRNDWAVNLSAGPKTLTSKPTPPAGQTRVDGIYLDGNSYIQTQNGDITLWAANEVLVATGSSTVVAGNGVRTLNGGNIKVTAQFGNVNTGANPFGYVYSGTAPYYTPSVDTLDRQVLGGISTAAGGNVTITAGNNVTSFLPTSSSGNSAAADAGSGAFGPEPGNVTINAGGNVFGHYVLANGVGTITAGGNIGGSPNVALSLVKGAWNLNAPNGNIVLQEVRNPNGIFNSIGQPTKTTPAGPSFHFFDYDPLDSVNLTAGIGVTLTDSGLPRLLGVANGVPEAVYPPTLNITAGAGGVTLQGNVALFQSPYGNLTINTTAGGNLTGNVPGTSTTPELLMSDSGSLQWLNATSFTDGDHGTAPIEVNNPNPVVVNVSGSMVNLTLSTTKETTLKVGGDMRNSNFEGQNLHASDVTSINVAGQIFNQSAYTFVFLTQPIPLLPAGDLPPNVGNTWEAIFAAALNPDVISQLAVPTLIPPSGWADYVRGQAALFTPNSSLQGNANDPNPGFVYDPATLRLGFAGPLGKNLNVAEFQQQFTVLEFGSDGIPLTYTGADGKQHFKTDTVSWADPGAITALNTASVGAPNPGNPALGYQVGGPGQFDVHAGSISLGNSLGILSDGVGQPIGSRYGNLAAVTGQGATLNVVSDGDVTMLTSTIASLGGGDLNVTSLGGSMDLGSQELFNTRRNIAFGLFSSGPGNVNVTAMGDIDVDGSRIASYDGGNISVESLAGNVNAGVGGTSFVTVQTYWTDPATLTAKSYTEEVFGSGIVANTLITPKLVPGAADQPGDISVATPRGDIITGQGGILQEALNGNVSAGPTITLTAGTQPSDTSPGFAGNIELGDSGVIGGSVTATANGNISGLVISRQNSTINAAQTFSGTVLAGGTASLSASSVSGSSTIVGVGGVSVSGTLGVGATVLSQSANVNGASANTLGSSANGTSAASSAANATTSANEQQVASNNGSDDEDKKKHAKSAVLTRRVSRVRVFLPPA